MKTATKAIIVLTLLLTLISLAHAQEYTGAKFGPWFFYAPYYFPADGSCMGCYLNPSDYLPIYEDPNPMSPGPLMPWPVAPRVRKTKRPRSIEARVTPIRHRAPAPRAVQPRTHRKRTPTRTRPAGRRGGGPSLIHTPPVGSTGR
ncbi:hypothetical protein ACFL2Q_10580 [Thermodesulfobacteriota bacterium]